MPFLCASAVKWFFCISHGAILDSGFRRNDGAKSVGGGCHGAGGNVAHLGRAKNVVIPANAGIRFASAGPAPE
jgi:hypothetical protein